jgi:single-stranded-DNA-specific exonuclease
MGKKIKILPIRKVVIKINWNFLSDKTPRMQNEDISSYILRLRGIKDKERFLNPSFRDLIPFDAFKNINDAAKIVIDGIQQNKNFCVYYDVDIDGISAGTIMYKYLKSHGVQHLSYKINTGKVHGIKHRDISEFNKIDILVIVDSLDLEYEVYNRLKEKGIQIVILDHHEFEEYPKSAVLVSSAKNYPNPHLSGSGVTWKFCLYLDSLLNTKYAKDLVDLAACGVVGDVCDISEESFENRFIIHCGLNNLRNEGLKTILNGYEFNSQAIIWSISPLINAACRTKNNDLAVQIFSDNAEYAQILRQLKEIKTKQDETVSNICDDIEPYLNLNSKIILLVIEDNNYSGLVATKIANKYCKPTIIVAYNYDRDMYKGSIRSYGIDNFKSLINSTNLAECEGHEAAAGIKFYEYNLIDLINVLEDKLKDIEFKLEKDIDLNLVYEEITYDLIQDLNKLNRITGKNFDAVKVALCDIDIENINAMQDKHTKFYHNDLILIKWNDIELYNQLSDDFTIDVVGNLQINNFAGKKQKQFIISDYRNIDDTPLFLR